MLERLLDGRELEVVVREHLHGTGELVGTAQIHPVALHEQALESALLDLAHNGRNIFGVERVGVHHAVPDLHQLTVEGHGRIEGGEVDLVQEVVGPAGRQHQRDPRIAEARKRGVGGLGHAVLREAQQRAIHVEEGGAHPRRGLPGAPFRRGHH